MKRISALIFAIQIFAFASCSKSGTTTNNQTTNSLPVIAASGYDYVGNVSARILGVSCTSSTQYTCGVCWSASDSPTVALSTQTSVFVAPNECAVTGLSSSTTYYARVFATNSVGTAYGQQMQFTTGTSFILQQYYLGGYIYYIDGTGNHGMIVAPSDQTTGAPWGCTGTTVTGASGTVIGTGAQNTESILSQCSDTGTAAAICRNLTLNGYSGWSLPSQNEFEQIIVDEWDTAICHCDGISISMFNIGELLNTYYWCSTEVDSNKAEVGVLNGTGTTISSLSFPAIYKNTYCHVRAVKAF